MFALLNVLKSREPSVLSKVRINNFRSCRDVTLEGISCLTVLSGRNGAGKTNILRAVEWAARAAVNKIQTSTIGLEKTSVELTFSTEYGDYIYFISVSTSYEKDGPKYFVLESLDSTKKLSAGSVKLISRKDENIATAASSESVKIDNSASALNSLLSLFPESEYYEGLLSAYSFLSSIKYYALDEPLEQVSAVTRYSEVIGQKTDKKDSFQSDLIVKKLISLAIERPEDYKEIVSLLGKNGLNIVDDMNMGYVIFPSDGSEMQRGEVVGPGMKNLREQAESIYIFTSFLISNDGSERKAHAYPDLSFGTRRLIRLFTYLIFDKPTAMLIEQPEDGIHLGLLHKVIPQLRAYSDQTQFILASHSAEIFNRLGPSELRLVAQSGGNTSARALDSNELEAAAEYLKTEGLFSDFLKLID